MSEIKRRIKIMSKITADVRFLAHLLILLLLPTSFGDTRLK